VRNTIETCLQAGVEPLQIASEVRISHQWVYQLRQVLNTFNTVSPPPPAAAAAAPAPATLPPRVTAAALGLDAYPLIILVIAYPRREGEGDLLKR
jgi:hypothetical protein